MIYKGDCLIVIPMLQGKSVQMVCTSPPYYGLRDYGVDGQIGLEATPEAYVEKLVVVFREVRRVLKDDGTLWLNLGDSYNGSGKGANADGSAGKAGKINSGSKGTQEGTFTKSNVLGLKPKDLIGIPWMVAFALRADGWYLRSDIIWSKPNPMPESVTDRCTKAHEYIFLLTKSARYFYDAEAVKEDSVDPESINGRRKRNPRLCDLQGDVKLKQNFDRLNGEVYEKKNRRSVWTITTKPFNGAKMMADYVGDDGKPYKLSKDCPVHGRLANRVKPQRGLDDGQSNLDSIHNLDKHNYPVSEPSSESDSMPLNSNDMKSFEGHNGRIPASRDGNKTPGLFETHSFDGQETDGETSFDTKNIHIPAMRPADSSDCLNPGSSEIATLHSKQNHKSTFQTASCDKVSGKIPCHKPDKKQPVLIADLDLPCDISITAKCTCQVITCDHFATFPPEIPEICIKAGSKKGDTVLDPFAGAGTTGLVAERLGRNFIGIELNGNYVEMAEKRLFNIQPTLWSQKLK